MLRKKLRFVSQSISLYVFNYKGRRIGSVKKGFKKACERAGLYDVTFHTLQHTYTSWLTQSKVSTCVLKELGGWKSMAMAQRYSHSRNDDLRQYQERLVEI